MTPRATNDRGLLRFTHRAMACDWEFLLDTDDDRYAGQAARAAAAEIDRLESELSRFVPTSDVARLNATPAGTALLLGADALAVLTLAEHVRDATRGAFDVAIGALVPHQPVPPDAYAALPDAPRGTVQLDRAARVALRTKPDVVVDLGAIGKGYAVDAAVEMLQQWNIPAGIVTSGQSTAAVFGTPRRLSGSGGATWRLALRDPNDHTKVLGSIALRDETLSGSGVELHGRHIIDPRRGGPADGPRGAWAVAPRGALSDAISTALMVLAREEACSCLAALPEVAGYVLDPAAAGGISALTADAAARLRT